MFDVLATKNIHGIAEYLDEMVQKAADLLNTNFSPRRLCKAPRNIEPLPIEKKQLSSYRTRIGTMLEYGLGSEVDSMLAKEHGKRLSLTFAAAHEYPDFYLRDEHLARLLRVEMKAVDAESDEQAARFAVPTAAIADGEDLLLLVGWEWAPIMSGTEEIGEYPNIFATLVVPACDIVAERDVRLAITGGVIRGDEVFVPGKSGGFVTDPGNYGKLWRLVHGTRREAQDLSPSIRKFFHFMRQIDDRSPRKRF